MDRPDPDWAKSQLGRLLGGRWTLVRLLGMGGTAAVFEATHRNGKRVAIKVLHPARARDQRLRNRFLREGYAANRVGHPSVVSIDDDGEEPDGTAFLVMELLAAESLDRAAERLGGRLPWLTVTELCLQLLEVLDAAHTRGVIHRDIKPANLLWSPGAPLRVLDFGLARFADPPPDDLVTGDGAVLGTPAFMAPEQARASADGVGRQTDIWALGATAFTLLTGRKVYEAPTVEERLALAATSEAPALEALAPEVPAPVAAVFQRALAYDPRDRWPSARAMLEALRAALGGAPALDTPEPAASDEVTFLNTIADEVESARPPSSRRTRKELPLSLLAGAVIAVGLLAWSLLRVLPKGAPVEGAQVSSNPPSQVAGQSAVAPPAVSAAERAPDTAPSVLSAKVKTPAPRSVKRGMAAGAEVVSPAVPAPSAAVDLVEEPPF